MSSFKVAYTYQKSIFQHNFADNNGIVIFSQVVSTL